MKGLNIGTFIFVFVGLFSWGLRCQRRTNPSGAGAGKWTSIAITRLWYNTDDTRDGIVGTCGQTWAKRAQESTQISACMQVGWHMHEEWWETFLYEWNAIYTMVIQHCYLACSAATPLFDLQRKKLLNKLRFGNPAFLSILPAVAASPAWDGWCRAANSPWSCRRLSEN